MSKFDLVPFLQHLENGHFGVQDMSVVVVVVVLVSLRRFIQATLVHHNSVPKGPGPMRFCIQLPYANTYSPFFRNFEFHFFSNLMAVFKARGLVIFRGLKTLQFSRLFQPFSGTISPRPMKIRLQLPYINL